ncbi:hypothetical protein ACH4NT_36965 [Streptomyces lydicus]|uniref:hypothetical protein n=1 Tax=Streptomyces lydicus TaxID=47763 RepID=UPI00379CAB51
MELHRELGEIEGPGVVDLLTLPEGRVQLRHLAALEPAVCWGRLMCSAKESVYKATYPLAHRWLGLEDPLLTLDPADVSFTGRLPMSGPQINGGELTPG